MPRKFGPEEFGATLQAFHGFDISIKLVGRNKLAKIWRFQVPRTGFRIEGKHAEIMAALRGYQAGYLAGRAWARGEIEGMKRLVEEVEARFRKVS